jgi:hypothetical protein
VKKTYISPSSRDIKVRPIRLLVASGGVNATGTSVTFGGIQKRSASEAASRSADDWDWDE